MPVRRRPTDVVVVAALPIEEASLLSQLEIVDSAVSLRGSYSPKLARLDIGHHRSIEVVVACAQEPGNVLSAIILKELLARWEPALVVSFGISGGLSERKPGKLDNLELGDVVVAEDVFYYERTVEGETRGRRYGHAYPHPRLVHLARVHYEDPNGARNIKWKQSLTFDPPEPLVEGHPKVFVGPVASGEKVIRNLGPMRAEILTYHTKTRAVEMEAYGVGTAAVKGVPEQFPLLIVKSIADFADLNKGDQWHDFACHSGATLLWDLLRLGASEDLLPARARRTTLKATEIDDRVELVTEALPENANVRFDRGSLRQAINSDTTQVYYHWRLRNSQIHWVDYINLLILRRLSRYPFLKVQLLVTDELTDRLPTAQELEAAKTATRTIVDGLFQAKATITWYSEILEQQDLIRSFAEREGLNYAIESRLDELYEHILGKEASQVTKMWIKFIAWRSRGELEHLFIVWERHARIYEEIAKYLNLTAAVIETGDHTIRGTLGKFEPPGLELTVEPPQYRSLVRWAIEEDSAEALYDVLTQLVLRDIHVQSFLTSQEAEGFMSRAALEELGDGGELARYVGQPRESLSEENALRLALGTCLVEWNRRYFTDRE